MNTDDILAMVSGLTQGRQLYVNLARPNGRLWTTGEPCTLRPPVNVQPGENAESWITIVPAGESGWYFNFPVDSASTDSDGHLVLTGEKGTATFYVHDA